MLGSPEATQFPLSSRPSSPPSQHLSHSKIIARWCQWPRRHYRSQSREGRRGGCNVCTRRGSGCQEGCDTCKSSPHFNPSQSSLRRHSFLYIWNEVEHHLSGTSIEMKVIVLFFFFWIPVLSRSRAALHPRFYSHLHTHLCLSTRNDEASVAFCIFFLSSTTKPSKQVSFTRRPHIANKANDNTWVTVLHCVTRSSIMINMPFFLFFFKRPCWISLFYIQKFLLRISNWASVVFYNIITLIN